MHLDYIVVRNERYNI